MSNIIHIELRNADLRLRRAITAIKSWKHGTFSYTGGETDIRMQKYALKELMKATLIAAHPNIITLHKRVPLQTFNQINFMATKSYIEADSAWKYFTKLIATESPEVLSENAIKQIAIQEIEAMGETVCRNLCRNINWNYEEIVSELNSPRRIDIDLDSDDELSKQVTDFIKTLF